MTTPDLPPNSELEAQDLTDDMLEAVSGGWADAFATAFASSEPTSNGAAAPKPSRNL